MAYQRGDILLVPFPYSNLSTTKIRPALVISSHQYQQQEPDLLLAALTSNLAATGALDYVLRHWQSAGLKFASAFKPVLFTLEPRLVVHPIGVIDAIDLIEIDQRLRLALSL